MNWKTTAAVAVFLAAAPVLLASAEPAVGKARRLAEILGIEPGMTVAEIGAGDGELTVEMARLVGASGHVYSTEVSENRLEKIRENVAAAGLENVTVTAGEATDANLPRECCDTIFMETVYHHFTHPMEMDASLYAAMKPGGRLAVIDFPPRRGGVDGVPKNRGGHGMPIDLLIQELEQAGFRLEKRIDDWRGRQYCMVFQKPIDADS
jgi:ubiquinone/menaquinone biosynthesis C-methylase UbiE